MKNVLIPAAIGFAAGVFLPTVWFMIFMIILFTVLLGSTVLRRKDKR